MNTMKSIIRTALVFSVTVAIAASATAGMDDHGGYGGSDMSPYGNSGGYDDEYGMYGEMGQGYYQEGEHPEDGTGMHYGHARNFRAELGPQHYNFDVDVSDDVFVNPARFGQVTGGMAFVDDNEDGVADIVQDTDTFQALGISPFMDENEDGIHDDFQTRGAYQALGMNNFVDVDGDGICDNYEAVPFDN